MNRNYFFSYLILALLASFLIPSVEASVNENSWRSAAIRFDNVPLGTRGVRGNWEQDDAPIKPPTDAVEVKPILPDPVKVKDGNKEETPQKLVAKEVKKTLIYGGVFAGAAGLMMGLGAGLGIKALLITGAVLGGAGLIVGVALIIGLLIGYGKAVEKMLG